MKIVNKRLDEKGFKKYITGKDFKPNNPNKIVIHHTWKPTEKDWKGQKTIDALKKYYEGKGWTSAPHIFVAPDGIWLFTDMKTQGTHAGVGNYRSIGIEVVGNYDGAKWTGAIRRQTLSVISDLIDELNLKMKDIRFHREYSNKTCPGSAITKEWLEEKLVEFRKKDEKKTEAETGVKVEVKIEPISEEKEPLPLMQEEKKELRAEEDIIDKQITNLINLILKIWKTLKSFFRTKE